MTNLSSAPVPALRDDDHVRGPSGAPLLVAYADFACPHCAVLHAQLSARDDVRVAFRHFALKTKDPRSVALACAAEAAALQGAFWPLHDRLYGDPGRTDDPHLWAHAEALGLDVGRFESDRRTPGVLARVKRDVTDGLRAGVTTTPALFLDGRGPERTPSILAGVHRSNETRRANSGAPREEQHR